MSLYIGETTKIFTKTLPFALVRTGIYLAFGTAALIYLGLLFGFMALVSKVGGSVGTFIGLLVFVAGLGGGYGLIHLAREWLLHLLKAGHVAVVTAFLTDGKLPKGKSQYEIGKQLVTEQFVDVNVLFVVDGLVKGSVRGFNRTIDNLMDMIPLPGMQSVAKWAGRIVDMAVNFIDETVLSYSLSKGDKNVWNSAMEGVVLYAQNYKQVLKNAAAMALLAWASYAVLVLALGIPFWPAAYAFGTGGHSILQGVFVLTPFVLGFVLKLSLVNPFAMISVLVTFHRNALGQPISPEWQGRIEAASDKFRELKQKALDFAGDKKAAGQPAEASPGTEDEPHEALAGGVKTEIGTRS